MLVLVRRRDISPFFPSTIRPTSSKRDAGPPLFDAYEASDQVDGNGDGDWPPRGRDRDIRSGDNQPGEYYHAVDSSNNGSSSSRGFRRRTPPPPPLLRHSLLAPSSPPPRTAAAAIEDRQQIRSAGSMGDNYRHQRAAAAVEEGQQQQQQQQQRTRVESRKSQQMPPQPPQRVGGRGTSSFRDSRGGGIGDGGGDRADVGVRTGGRDEEEEKAGLGLSAASIGSVGGELRGGELERVRGRVADLGAAIETSQVR